MGIIQMPFYVFGFAISLGIFNWELVTEAFLFENRIKFASICFFVQWITNAALSMTVDIIIYKLFDGNISDLYFIFGGLTIFCIAFINKYIPKTTGKSLENAVKMYIQ